MENWKHDSYLHVEKQDVLELDIAYPSYIERIDRYETYAAQAMTRVDTTSSNTSTWMRSHLSPSFCHTISITPIRIHMIYQHPS